MNISSKRRWRESATEVSEHVQSLLCGLGLQRTACVRTKVRETAVSLEAASGSGGD